MTAESTMSNRQVTPTTKPDPNEPWRYVCRDCKGQVNGRATEKKYTCVNCRARWRRSELLDLKAMASTRESSPSTREPSAVMSAGTVGP